MDKNLGVKIIKLRKKGFSYNQIAEKLKCRKSSVSYHCGLGQKRKYQLRQIRNRENINKKNKIKSDFIDEFIWRHKRLIGCKDCGLKNPIVLDYDHIDSKNKFFSVSSLRINKASFDTIKKEIRKCDIRCSNCHRIKTVIDRGHYKKMIEKYGLI